jgi:hypothetical protein
LSAIVGQGKWTLPAALPGAGALSQASASVSPCYDILGRELSAAASAGDIQFCVHAKATSMSPLNDLLRVDVRVVWIRGIATATSANIQALNSANLVQTDALDITLYHAIYATTAVKESPAQSP